MSPSVIVSRVKLIMKRLGVGPPERRISRRVARHYGGHEPACDRGGDSRLALPDLDPPLFCPRRGRPGGRRVPHTTIRTF
jgi:hypothetical protein